MNYKTLIKTLIYRLICTTETFLIAWWITGEIMIGGSLAVSLFFVKLITYYLHEMMWNKKGNK